MNQSYETLFVGREEELSRLMAFAKEAFAGKAGVAFVTGEAGIGKTYLVQEFFRRLRHEYEDVAIASGQCTLQRASYLPFQAILEDLLESHKQVKVSSQKFKQVTEVVVDTIWNVGPDLIGVFGIPIKALQTVIDKLGLRGKKSADKLEIPKDLDQIKIFGWYTKVMKDISLQFPLVLFLDDLHWADDSSLNLLLYLGRETENQRMLVIGTYRPHEVAPNSLLMQIKATLGRYGAREFALDVSPNKVEDVEKTRQFVHDYLLAKYGTNFSDQFERVLVDRTEGNALFLSEILKNLEEKGQISRNDNMYSLHSAFTFADLPEKVENAISERINRLEETLREILDYASVEGDEFIAQVIAKVRELQERSLINDLTKKLMKTHQLILERGGKSLPNGNRIHEFSFKHNLIREYVYAQLSDTDKEFIHAEIGECLEKLYEPNADEIAAQLAIHFYRGHILDKVVSYCLKAAQDANARYGAAEALHFVKMGLQALESRIKVLPQQEYAETKVQLLLELARSEKNGGDPQEKKDHIQEGINYLESSLSLLYNLSDKFYAEIYSELGKLYDRKGLKYSKKVKEYLEKALYVYEKQNNKRNVAEILYHLAGADVYPNILSAPGEKNPEEKCIDVLRKAILIAEQMQDIDLQIKCTIRLSAHMKRKDFRYAEKGVLRALELWENFGKSDKSFEVLIEMAYICRQGYARHKTGIKYLNQALEFAKRTGDVGLESWILYVVGASFGFYTTLQRKAQITMEEALLIREKTGIRKYLMLSRIGNIFLRQGQWKNAEEYIQKAINESRWERYNLWQLYLFQENYPQAEKELLHKLEQREKYKRFPNILIYTGLALNYALLGKEEQSQKYLEHAYSLLEQKTIPIEKSEALYIIAETQRLLENFESSKIACQQALSWFLTNAEDPEELISVAEVRLTMGKILVDMADYQEAITYLDKAKAAFEICGHYALGETLLYLGKAHLGLGGVIFQRQAQEYLNQALAEFQRLELRHKEQEAKEVLKAL